MISIDGDKTQEQQWLLPLEFSRAHFHFNHRCYSLLSFIHYSTKTVVAASVTVQERKSLQQQSTHFSFGFQIRQIHQKILCSICSSKDCVLHASISQSRSNQSVNQSIKPNQTKPNNNPSIKKEPGTSRRKQ